MASSCCRTVWFTSRQRPSSNRLSASLTNGARYRVRAFVARRFATFVATVIGVTLIVFLMIRVIPGDPANTILGLAATPGRMAELHAKLGLDQPIPVQYLIWLAHTATLDLGESYVRNAPVAPIVLGALVATLVLVGSALIMSTILGIFFGVICAARRGSVVDKGVLGIALVGLSLPEFWFGMVLIVVFSVTLHVFPSGGMTNPASPSLADIPSHLVLPAIALAIGPMAVMVRLTRSSMLEVLSADYVKTARAKGVGPTQVNFRHALRNALIPIVTLLGIQFGFIMGSAVLIEVVFSWPGLGQLLLQAVQQRDYPLIQGCVFLLAILLVFINLLIDTSYAWLDPSIRHG
jgi:peptide/nickel transport system permease protein